jgi:hypothetical protein
MSASAGLRIAGARPAGRDEWERACRACDYATFFHTPAWVDLFTKTTGGAMAPATEAITFSDGLSAILPMARRRYLGGLVQLYWSMPAHTFGGWVSEDSLTAEHARLMAEHLGKRPDLQWRENPYDPVLQSIALPLAHADFTHAVDLSGGISAVEGRFDYAHRKAVRKAVASGVTVAEGVLFEEWESYFSLYGSSRARWKERRLARGGGYPHALFQAIYDSGCGGRKLWLAKVKGVPAAGILCFYWNRHAVAWLGAGEAEFFMYRPNNLLYEHAIRHAAGQGYRWFDCNPSAGLRGVIEFKEHLGAVLRQSRVVEKRTALRWAAERARSLFR